MRCSDRYGQYCSAIKRAIHAPVSLTVPLDLSSSLAPEFRVPLLGGFEGRNVFLSTAGVGYPRQVASWLDFQSVLSFITSSCILHLQLLFVLGESRGGN
jgi:hypothetical protein